MKIGKEGAHKNIQTKVDDKHPPILSKQKINILQPPPKKIKGKTSQLDFSPRKEKEKTIIHIKKLHRQKSHLLISP